MARQNPFAGKREPRYSETRTLVNPDTLAEDTLSLQHLDEPLSHLAQDVGNRLILRYVGSAEYGIAPQAEFPSVDGLPVDLSDSLCRTAANIYVMQLPRPDGGDVYSEEETLAFAIYQEGFWKALEAFANEVNREGENRKNARRASPVTG